MSAGTGSEPTRARTQPLSAAGRSYVVNEAADLARELVAAYVADWPHLLRVTKGGLVTRRRRKRAGRVGLIIGNGLGHEPAMLGLVGQGLFDVNVPGQIFAAPAPALLAQGIREADRGAGVLLLVSNHSGDVLSARVAIDMVLQGDGPPTQVAVVGEDIGGASGGPQEGRRGGAGLLFVWKMVGAAAELSDDLGACGRLATEVAARTRSLSATIAGTINPVTGQCTVAVPWGKVLLGSGVHGDGSGDVLPLGSARELVSEMIDRLLSSIELGSGDGCLLMANDSGAMSVAELAIIHNEARLALRDRGIMVLGGWHGRYATTFATTGFSLGLCAATSEEVALWKAPCRAPALCSWGMGPVG